MIQERRKLTKNLTLLDFRREVELGAIISGRFARATRKLKIQDKPICFSEVYPNVKKRSTIGPQKGPEGVRWKP